MKYENAKDVCDILEELDKCDGKLDVLNYALIDLRKKRLRAFHIVFGFDGWQPEIIDDGYLYPIMEEFLSDSIQHLETKKALLKNKLESL